MTLEIIFFGTPSFAIPTLEALFKGSDEIVAAVTQPDRRKGRGQKVAPSAVKELLLKHGVPILQPETVKDEAFLKAIRNYQPDLFVVVAYGQILPKSLLIIPKKGAINLHASLLPKYRGAAPIPWAIRRGEKVTGVTTMMMDEGMDTGDILLQREVAIDEKETSETLHEKLAPLGAHLLLETLEKIKTGNLRPIPQEHSKATYAPPIKKQDGHIDWSMEALEIDRQVRSLSPWPGAFTGLGGRLLKICKGEVKEGGSGKGKAGTVVWVGSDFIEVETGKDLFIVQEVQPEGKRRMKVRDFLSGHSIPLGTEFHSLQI